jgi:ketosteroid isomerase-like protein
MYHMIVRAKVRSIFASINAGNYESMLASLAPTFTYRFYGDHALGGERHTVAAMRLWWERIFAMMPDPTFEVREVLVTGWPWNTKIATSVHVSAPLPEGGRYDNYFNQFIWMKNGKVTRIETLEETQNLLRTLDYMAAHGHPEAHAAPITDELPNPS